MTTVAAATWRRFLVPEAYPIIFLTGAATMGFAGFFTRIIVSDPDIRCTKELRSNGYPDPETETQKAEKHYNHFIRRNRTQSLDNIGIFPNNAILRMTSNN